MKRFHKAEDEKRMVVILDPSEYETWLSCPVARAPGFFKQWMGPLDTYEAPLPPRAPSTYSGKVIQPPSEPSLF